MARETSCAFSSKQITGFEIGLGPGYSAIMLLVATTEGKWNEGATLVEFDLGLEADQGDGYGPRKKIAHKYIQKVFEKRARFIFGNSDKTLPAFQKEGKKCDVIHIDGSHNKEGVITDLKSNTFTTSFSMGQF